MPENKITPARKLHRRWIGCDINKGVIQLTAKGIAKIVKEQAEKDEGLFDE